MVTCINRLTVIGSKREIERFQNSPWEKILRAESCEVLELLPGRFACQFESPPKGLAQLQALSKRWPKLVLLLEFEIEHHRIKGMAKANAGDIDQCTFSY